MTPQMTPHMAQAGPSAGQMLAQMSRQNGVTHSVTPSHSVPPSSTVAPLQGGPAGGGWPAAGAGARPQFNNQVTLRHNCLVLSNGTSYSRHPVCLWPGQLTVYFPSHPAGGSTGCKNHVSTICTHGRIWRWLFKLFWPDAYRCFPNYDQWCKLSPHECARQPQHQRLRYFLYT